jgi:PPK2 family polyphosphate:nucleotide phosphotransferase
VTKKRASSERWAVAPGTAADLAGIDPASTAGAPGAKKATEAATAKVLTKVAALHDKLWAEAEQSLLLVLQAIDTGGKDGTISHVLRGLNPQGVNVRSFKVPTDVEKAHDYLWRVHQVVPRKGELGVFNRSHYEDVLVVRVHDIVPEAVWRPRFEQINEFEELLTAAGTTIVKCFLHISKEEQAERLQARLDDPTKRWKFKRADLDERAHWDDYMAAFEEAISRTSTAHAPWYVVPANAKWYRNFAVATILLDALERMDPQYPPPEDDIEGVEIS